MITSSIWSINSIYTHLLRRKSHIQTTPLGFGKSKSILSFFSKYDTNSNIITSQFYKIIQVKYLHWHGTQRPPVQSTGTAATGLHFRQLPLRTTARQHQLSHRASKAQGMTGRRVARIEYRPPAATMNPSYVDRLTDNTTRPLFVSFCKSLYLYTIVNKRLSDTI